MRYLFDNYYTNMRNLIVSRIEPAYIYNVKVKIEFKNFGWMKKSIVYLYLAAMVMITLPVFAENNLAGPSEVEKVILFSNSYFQFSLLDENQKTFFNTIEYNSVKERLSFETKSNIMLIQIYNAKGDLEFQLPVGSDVVHISRKLFSSGEYTLQFLFEGEQDFQSTELNVN